MTCNVKMIIEYNGKEYKVDLKETRLEGEWKANNHTGRFILENGKLTIWINDIKIRSLIKDPRRTWRNYRTLRELETLLGECLPVGAEFKFATLH